MGIRESHYYVHCTQMAVYSHSMKNLKRNFEPIVTTTQSVLGSRNPLRVVITKTQSVLGPLTHFG